MDDLNLTMDLLSTSADLEQASVSLRRMAEGLSINKDDKEHLSWAGNFLVAMDWGSNAGAEPQISGGLAVQATTIRPTFYSCLFRIAPSLKEVGICSEQQLGNFLSSLYRNLISHGSPGRGFKKLTKEESILGVLLLREMAESILVQINNNGLPKTNASIKDDWQPTPKEYVAIQTF